MNELGQYLDALARRKSDIVTAQVTTRNDDGTYMCQLITTKATVRASRSNSTEEYKVGSWVILGAPSASRAVVGAMHMIISRAPAEQRGLSETTPDTSDEVIPSAAILSVDPEPLLLVQGGDSGVLVIRGHGFRTAAAFDPSITDGAAPVVTATEVTMTLMASNDSAIGRHDGAIDNQPLTGAVRVIAHIALLIAGADTPVATTLSGTAFDPMVVPTYSGAPFAIFTFEDPVITAETIDLLLGADYDIAAAGDYDIIVGALTFPHAIHVRRPTPVVTGSTPDPVIIYIHASGALAVVVTLIGTELYGRPTTAFADPNVTIGFVSFGSNVALELHNVLATAAAPYAGPMDITLTDPVSGSIVTASINVDIHVPPAFTITAVLEINAVAGGPAVADTLIGTGFCGGFNGAMPFAGVSVTPTSETTAAVLVAVPGGTAPGTYSAFCVPAYIGGTPTLFAHIHVT